MPVPSSRPFTFYALTPNPGKDEFEVATDRPHVNVAKTEEFPPAGETVSPTRDPAPR